MPVSRQKFRQDPNYLRWPGYNAAYYHIPLRESGTPPLTAFDVSTNGPNGPNINFSVTGNVDTGLPGVVSYSGLLAMQATDLTANWQGKATTTNNPNPGANPFSLEVWMDGWSQNNSGTVDFYLIAGGGDVNASTLPAYALMINGNKTIKFVISRDDTPANSRTVTTSAISVPGDAGITGGPRYHIVAVFERVSHIPSIYLNGALAATGSAYNFTLKNIVSATIGIAIRHTTGTPALEVGDGRLQNVVYYDYAKTAAEILEDYKLGTGQSVFKRGPWIESVFNGRLSWNVTGNKRAGQFPTQMFTTETHLIMKGDRFESGSGFTNGLWMIAENAAANTLNVNRLVARIGYSVPPRTSPTDDRTVNYLLESGPDKVSWTTRASGTIVYSVFTGPPTKVDTSFTAVEDKYWRLTITNIGGQPGIQTGWDFKMEWWLFG